MRPLVPLALLGFLAAATASEARAEPGLTTRVPSEHVGEPVPVRVLLPPSYARDEGRRYPVVYFLHDARGDERILERKGVARALLDGMRHGTVPEMIVVSPRGKGTWFVDAHDGRRRYASFLSEELVPWVDRSFRTVADRSGRAVTGISMGGYGALRWALSRPDLFSAAGGLSPAILQLNWQGIEKLPFFVRPSLKRVFGGSATDNALAVNDIYGLLLSRPELSENAPHVLLRCGTEDEYRLGDLVGFLGKYLDAFGVANDVALDPGAHDWAYWRTSATEMVTALGQRIAGEARVAESGPRR